MPFTSQLRIGACVIVFGCLAGSAALAQTCPQLAPANKYVLLRGETTGQDGQKRSLAYCLSRQRGQAVIETLDGDSKVQMRARYDGIKALSTEIIKGKRLIEFTYAEPGGSFTRPKPGDAATFFTTFAEAGQQPRKIEVDFKIEKTDPVTISGCTLKPIQMLRRNTDQNNVVVNLRIVFSPELNWPVVSETKGPGAAQAGGTARPAVLTQMTSIAPAEEAQRVCEAAQVP